VLYNSETQKTLGPEYSSGDKRHSPVRGFMLYLQQCLHKNKISNKSLI